MQKIKRIAALVLTLCLAAAMLPATAQATEEATLEGVSIVTLPGKTEYWLGESLDTTGLTLLVTYSDGSTEEITGGFAVTGFDSSVLGEQTLTVSYLGAADTFAVTVKRREVTYLAVSSLPGKTEYWLGESLDIAGLTLVATYSDGSTEEITQGFTVTGFNSASAGQQTLTVSYLGAATTFPVTVNTADVTGIEIISFPDKTEYWEGEALQTQNLRLVVSYSSGNTAEVTEGFTVTGFDSSSIGTQTLTVSYLGATDTFTVTVKKLQVQGIQVHTLPQKTEYYTGQELDITGLSLLVTYLNGTEREITEGFTVTGFDKDLAGQQVLTVWYEDATAEFSVTVVQLCLTDLVIAAPPQKTRYWIGESLDTTGLVLEATYSDGSTLQITKDYAVSGFSSATAGTKVLTVEYDGMFVVLDVEVVAPTSSTVTGVEICTLPDKTEYQLGEKKDWTGLSLYVVYSDGSKEVITSGFADSGFSSTTTGTKTVTVRYKLRYTAKFTVQVVCLHTEVENGICADCGEKILAVVTDSTGTQTGNFITLDDALSAVPEGGKITVQADAEAVDVQLAGAVLDLNGYTLTVNSVLTFSTGAILDSSEAANGLLVIRDADGNMISPDNAQLPVYDSEAGGYRFFSVTVTPKAITGGNKYWFTVDVENFEKFYALILSGAEVAIQVKMTWDGQSEAIYAVADPAFTVAWADGCNANRGVYITVSIAEKEGLENFRLTPGITSGGVEVFGEKL